MANARTSIAAAGFEIKKLQLENADLYDRLRQAEAEIERLEGELNAELTMANSEDVLERARVLQQHTRMGVYPADVWEARSIIDALAAEVRELRRDRARLDWVLENCSFTRRNAPLLPDWKVKDKEWIDKQVDATMGGGEGEA